VFDFLYQFLQHTRYVPALGPVGWIFNTPSHHRVHHGREAKYLDKNYGGILIIWDRMFGTFKAEEEEPTYGITRPIGSLNAAWGNLAMFADLRRAAAPLSGREKLSAWLSGPDRLLLLRPDLPAPPAGDWSDEDTPRPIRAYVIATAPFAAPLLGWMLMYGGEWSLSVRLFVATLVVLSVVCAGGLLERKDWAVDAEVGRILLAAVGSSLLLTAAWPLAAGAMLLAGLAGTQLAATPRPRALAK
jgi:alkylglycerol monooxygenase